jgi:mannose-6-phosphate isomerase-like protein (cupin superfamily)
MTLMELANQSGLSVSFLSQVERGLTNPSINSLRKVAFSLNTPLSFFFEEGSQNSGPVIKKDDRKVLISTDSLLTYQLLSPDPGRRIEFLITRLEVGGTSAESPMTHQGDEAALILQGKGRFQVDGQLYDLEEGDFIYIRENQPHKFTNTGNVPLIIAGAISPPGF